MSITRNGSEYVLSIADALDTGTTDALRRDLAEALDREARLAVDLSGVRSCDLAGLQLLHAAHKSAIRLNKPFRISALSEAAAKTAAALGINLQELTSAGAPKQNADSDSKS
jgi:anti-anti-sigma factor